jgi:hypothetical protein
MLQPEDIKKNEFLFRRHLWRKRNNKKGSRCCKILVCANHSVKSRWRKCVVRKKKVTNLYVCEQFCNRLQLSKIKTRNIIARRKMNTTNEYDRPDSCLILFFFHFFYSHSLNYSKRRAHIHTRFPADKWSFHRFLSKLVMNKDYLLKFYDDYLTENKNTDRLYGMVPLTTDF